MQLSERTSLILDEIPNNYGQHIQIYEGSTPGNSTTMSFWMRLSEQKQHLKKHF